MNQENSKGIFLNGKQQIIDMLRFMNPDEKTRILKAISCRNGNLAKELMEKSVSFNSLVSLSDEDLEYCLNFIKAPIMGIALKILKRSQQQRILNIASREYAESAYKVFTTNLQNEERDIKRATERIAETLGRLHKRGQIKLL